ncbi:hypothetical protein SKAU_G00093000 [Synaphobranchus kaupii]|uniref:Tumor protein p53-inducible protein 13 n=1 Tax=Synaphobranchus kaupii TaxID=118154 RepID=A0A9Q1J5L2_SYNKA|nr:hypothetical protein SKAU_G00093000 [Synaphobranchus kaupii]
MNSAGWRRRARWMVQLLLCFSLFLCWVDASMWHLCDNGKLLLEKDLPLSAVYRCAGTSWSESTQKLPSIDTKHPLQPALSVCIQTPITYNHTIPSSGTHRPVGAESGEYLYCPPQRWLHNLQHGATVLLYHPCAPVSERVRLSVLARSCLSHYIITPHYQLHTNRPFAMVLWGRTLELSHVTESGACNWLEVNAADSFKSRKIQEQKRHKYNLYLMRPAGERGAQTERQQSLKRCCEEALSLLWEEDAEMDWNGREKKRRMRTVFSQGKGQREKREETKKMYKGSANSEVPSHLLPQNMGPEQAEKRSTVHRPGRETQTRGKPVEAVTGRHWTKKEENAELKQTEGVREKTQEELGGQWKDEREPQQTHNKQRESQTLEAVEHRGERGERWEKQEKRETSREQRYGGDTDTESELRRGNGHPKPKQQTQKLKGQPDSGTTMDRDSPACCGCMETEAPVENAVLEQRQPTPRTDEAVWAAAALGFLLVLLALSVLHTRLYQHWRTTPSLYWYHPQHDYDSVADVVRRRLKMSGGRRKRRAPQSRRQECVLLPSSSTEESE